MSVNLEIWSSRGGVTCECVSELRGSDRGSAENVNRAWEQTWPMLMFLVRTVMRRMTMRDVVVQECESVSSVYGPRVQAPA